MPVYTTEKRNIYRASMRVDTPSATTITDADTYYQIAGTFTDGETYGFTVATDGTITYNGIGDRLFLVLGNSDLDVDQACKITYALEKNDIIDTTSATPHDFVSPSKVGAIGINRIVKLNNGDVLKIKAKSDTAEISLTAETLYLSIIEL